MVVYVHENIGICWYGMHCLPTFNFYPSLLSLTFNACVCTDEYMHVIICACCTYTPVQKSMYERCFVAAFTFSVCLVTSISFFFWGAVGWFPPNLFHLLLFSSLLYCYVLGADWASMHSWRRQKETVFLFYMLHAMRFVLTIFILFYAWKFVNTTFSHMAVFYDNKYTKYFTYSYHK